MSSKKKPGDALQECVPMLRALADATRLEMVRALARGALPAGSIAAETGVTLYNASRHLRVLREAGLVETEVCGQQRIYRLTEAIQAELKRKKDVLDLGCCSFRLDGKCCDDGKPEADRN